ncbi:chymotrypsinogen A-like [Oculina patagonica]
MLTFLGFIAVLIVPVPSPTEAECGKRLTQQYAVRVVNGQDAAPNSWPWQISLRHTKYGHICGGSLIEKDVILTAAQCVTFESDPASFKVVVGAHNLEGSPTSVQETINVAKVTYHSGFNPTTMENDLALLKLEKSITSSDKVNTVCLPKSRTDQISAGTYCYLTGKV